MDREFSFFFILLSMTLKVEEDLVFTATIVHNGQEQINAAGSFTRTEMMGRKKRTKAGFKKVTQQLPFPLSNEVRKQYIKRQLRKVLLMM